MKKVLIVGATHGHEVLGVEVINDIKKDNNVIGVDFIIGNPEAYKKRVAYLESDLNRVFPGNSNGDYEEKRAYEISKKIKNYDIVIDIHSTDTNVYDEDSMLIVTKLNAETEECVCAINPPKVVLMDYMNEHALISKAKVGLAFEYGSNHDFVTKKAVFDGIYALLSFSGNLKKEILPQKKTEIKEVYRVYDIYSKKEGLDFNLDEKIKNFVEIIKGQKLGEYSDGHTVDSDDNFYPILFGENRYKKIIGFKSKQIKKN